MSLEARAVFDRQKMEALEMKQQVMRLESCARQLDAEPNKINADLVASRMGNDAARGDVSRKARDTDDIKEDLNTPEK